MIALVPTMPVGSPGKHRLKIYIREKTDTPKEWKEAGSMPLEIAITSEAAQVPSDAPKT